MTNRTHILLCVCLLVVLAGLGVGMRALFPERIDLPFDTTSTILAAEFSETPEEFGAVIGVDRRYAESLKLQQYLDFPFIVCYVALFALLAYAMRAYDVPAARWVAWLAIGAAVAAGVFDILENLTILRGISSTAQLLHIRRYSLPKWGLAFLVMFLESGVFFFWPRLNPWFRLGAVVTGGLWLAAGASGLLFASLASVIDIPWSVAWLSWGIGAALVFLAAIAVRDRLNKV